MYLAIWAGFCLLMAGLLLWHFFLPVNRIALWVFMASAVISLALERRWFAVLFSKRVSAGLSLAIAAFSIWTANHALGPGGMDDFNYEFQAVRWFHDYRIVPGLGNLLGRIGFNNSHHLFAAMLSSGPWSGSVNHVFNGLFVALTLTLLLANVCDLACRRIRAQALVGALLLSPCVGLVLFGIFGSMISTLKADVFVCAATATLAVLFIEFTRTSGEDPRYLALATTILLLSAVLFSVKISAAVFTGMLALAVVIRLGTTVGWRHRVTAVATLMAALIFCSVLARGIILTGYPLYPSTLLRAKVDWRVPITQAEAERAYIISWAQLRPTYDPSAVRGWTWISAWAKSTVLSDKFDIVLPAILTLSCLLLLLFRSRRAPAVWVPGWGWATIAAASSLSLVVWFFQAPAGRFAFIHFWIIFAVVFAISVGQPGSVPRWAATVSALIAALSAAYALFIIVGIPRPFRSSMAMMIIFAAVWTIASTWAIAERYPRLLAALCLALGFYQIGDRILAHLLLRRFPQIEAMLWLNVGQLPEHAGKAQYVPRETRQGVVVYQLRDGRYDAPLPNTQYFNPSLELRYPSHLRGGFRNPGYQNSAHYGYSVRIVTAPDGKSEELSVPDR